MVKMCSFLCVRSISRCTKMKKGKSDSSQYIFTRNSFLKNCMLTTKQACARDGYRACYVKKLVPAILLARRIFCRLFHQHVMQVAITTTATHAPKPMPILAPTVRCGPHVGNPGIPQRPALSVKLKAYTVSTLCIRTNDRKNFRSSFFICRINFTT